MPGAPAVSVPGIKSVVRREFLKNRSQENFFSVSYIKFFKSANAIVAAFTLAGEPQL